MTSCLNVDSATSTMQWVTATTLCVVLCTTSQVSARERGINSGFTTKAPGFLEPIEPTFTLADTDPKQQSACRGVKPGECVTLLSYGGNSSGGIPTVAPSFKANVPNVRVDVVLQRARISGHPMEPQDLSVTLSWKTSMDSVTQHSGENSSYFLDGAASVTAAGYLHNPAIIYSAVVLGGCDSFQTLAMTHRASMITGASTLPFEGEDTTTLDATGFYNFNYSIPVDAADDFSYSASVDLSGKVNVTCTAQSEL